MNSSRLGYSSIYLLILRFFGGLPKSDFTTALRPPQWQLSFYEVSHPAAQKDKDRLLQLTDWVSINGLFIWWGWRKFAERGRG